MIKVGVVPHSFRRGTIPHNRVCTADFVTLYIDALLAKGPICDVESLVGEP